MFSSRNNTSRVGKSKPFISNNESSCTDTDLDDNPKSKNFCFKYETNIKDKLQRIRKAGQVYIGSKIYERDESSNQVKYKSNVADRARRQKNDSTELQFNEQNVNTLRYKYKRRKSTPGNKEKHEINKVRKAVAKESYKSSSADDNATNKSLMWLFHVKSKNQILDLQSTDTRKNNSVYGLKKLEDNNQNVCLWSDFKKTKYIKKKVKHKNNDHETNMSKHNRIKNCSKLDNSRTAVDGLSTKVNKYLTTSASPITTVNSCSSEHRTNISQYKLETEKNIKKQNNKFSDTISAEQKETIKEKLQALRPSKYKRFHLILKRIEKKITEDIEKKLRKVLKMPEIKTYFQNTLLENADEKKTISTLMGALMQVIIILESQCIERREKSNSGSKTDESVDQKQSTQYYVTNQQGNSDFKCRTNVNNNNSISSASDTYFTPDDLKSKHLIKNSKKHKCRKANCKNIVSSKLNTQNDVKNGNDYNYNDIDMHLSKIFGSCISSEMSKYRTVRKYKKKAFGNKFNFEFQSIFKDSSSVITQNHNTYSANVTTNDDTQFSSTQTKDSLCSKKDLKVLSLLNEIYNTPNITDDKLNKLSLAVLKNIDCSIEKEDIPYIIVELNKLVKYSKDIYDQIYNIYKTVNTVKGDKRNIFLMQHLFSKRKYNSNCFETIVPENDKKISTDLNAEYNSYDTNKTEMSDICVGSEKSTEISDISSALNVKMCLKGEKYCVDRGTVTVCLNNKHTGINKTSEPVMLKSTLSGNDEKLDFTDMSISQSEDREYLCVPEYLLKIQNKNENIPTFNIKTTESAMINRAKEIYESYFRCGDHKSNIQGTETCYLRRKFSQENIANLQKSSDLYDVEMTDDSQNYSSDIRNEMHTNYFKNSFIPISKNYNPKVFNNKKINIRRCKNLRRNYGERPTCKRKYAIDSVNRAPKRQCIEDQENCFGDFIPQHKSINGNHLISYQNANLIREKKQLSDKFKNRTIENIPYNCNDTFMIYSNNKFKNLNDSLRLQSANCFHSKCKLQNENEIFQIHNKGNYPSHVGKYSEFVDNLSYINCDPQFSYNNGSESKSKQNSLVNNHKIKYKTNSSNHKISTPYPYHYRKKAMLQNKKEKLMPDSGFRHNCAKFGKNEGIGGSESFLLRYSCYPHHKIIKESNGIRIIAEDVVGKTSNEEELLQNVKHILNNTLKNSAVQTFHTDHCHSMEQETNCTFSSVKVDNFQSKHLENVSDEPVKRCDIFEGSQLRDNSCVCMKDKDKFCKPQILESNTMEQNQHLDDKQSECQKNNVLKHNLIKSEAELCCVMNTSSMDTTNCTLECTNQHNLVPKNNINNSFLANSYAHNLQDSSNNKESIQFTVKSSKENAYLSETTFDTKKQSNIIKTVIQKDSRQHLKCSDIPPEECQEGHVLDSNNESPLQVKDSVKIYLKKDECIEITLNRHSLNNVSIQKLAKVSEAEFKKDNYFNQREILGHASISADCINLAKKVNVDSTDSKTKINPSTRSKINPPYKITDFEKAGKKIISENDHSCYNSAMKQNRYNSDKNVNTSPAEMNEAQNINVYYCLADSHNSNRLFHPSIPPNINKSSYMSLLHCHENRSLNKTNMDKRLFQYVSLPQGSNVQEGEYYNSKHIQIPKHLSAQRLFQENRSQKSVLYDSSQSDPIDSSYMECRKKSKKGLRKINWSTFFSKLFKGRQVNSNGN